MPKIILALIFFVLFHKTYSQDKVFNVKDEYIELQNKMIEIDALKEFTFEYNNQWLTYGVVKIKDRYWLDRNLGAERVPETMNDRAGFGHYFQWGREADGHQLLDSITPELSALPQNQPGHSYFIYTNRDCDVSNGDWTKDTGWKYRWVDKNGIKTNNDVCPDGWRIPTITEWDEIAFMYKIDSALFNSKLKLVKAGCNSSIKASKEQVYGFYWSSNFDVRMGKVFGRAFYFNANGFSDAWEFTPKPIRGFPVRCIKE